MKRLWLAMLAVAVVAGASAPVWGQTAEELWKQALAAKSPDEQIRLYTEYLRLRPDDAVAYFNRGFVYSKKNLQDLAIADYSQAIQLKPDDADAYTNRGIAYGSKNLLDLAIADYTKAIQLRPGYALALKNRGILYGQKRMFALQKADYEKWLQSAPEDAGANNALAWFLATSPADGLRDGKRALELALKAVRLQWDANFMDTLAAAYAEVGQWEEAVKTQEQAVALKRANPAAVHDISEYEDHLKAYKTRKPWREK